MNKILTRLLVPLVLLLVVVGLLVTRDKGAGERTVTAHFDRAVSVYVGTDVRILGVSVGGSPPSSRRAPRCGSR